MNLLHFKAAFVVIFAIVKSHSNWKTLLKLSLFSTFTYYILRLSLTPFVADNKRYLFGFWMVFIELAETFSRIFYSSLFRTYFLERRNRSVAAWHYQSFAISLSKRRLYATHSKYILLNAIHKKKTLNYIANLQRQCFSYKILIFLCHVNVLVFWCLLLCFIAITFCDICVYASGMQSIQYDAIILMDGNWEFFRVFYLRFILSLSVSMFNTKQWQQKDLRREKWNTIKWKCIL